MNGSGGVAGNRDAAVAPGKAKRGAGLVTDGTIVYNVRHMKRLMMAMMAALPCVLWAEAYEIGADMEEESFWTSDPVLFVKRHAEAGFEFTSDQRDGADTRQDGGVTYYGLPVYESRLAFGEAGGIERVELTLYAPAGTETIQEMTDDSGRKFRRRVRIDKTIGKGEFGEILKTVRGKLTKGGKKAPASVAERTKDASIHQSTQT